MSYIAVGARTDCRIIIEKFSTLKTLRYHSFTQIWRELKFSYIYYGHNCLEELIEFTEEVLRITKELWLKSEVLNEQAGGLYTLYGLYLKQPTDGLVKVRITPRDYELIEKFHNEVRVGGHHDANYILARMFLIGAFRFCISEYSYGLEKCFRRYHESDRSLLEIKEEPSYIKRLKNEDFFVKLEDAFKQYYQSKCQLGSENSDKPPALLHYVDPQFPEKLKEEFQKITHSNDDSTKTQEAGSIEAHLSSTTDSKSSSKLKSSKFKLPWWMLPVKNRIRKDSTSESEAENDNDNTNVILQRNRAPQEDELSVVLGMSGDEEGLEEQLELCQASSSCNMPALS